MIKDLIKNKKIKKLLKDPKLFTIDLIKNKKKLYLPKPQVTGKHNYTVVSAVYGVEKYLDDYFKSLVNQTLDFKKHIYLVLVDDGSLDSSASIIKKWQKKYPNNITYVRKENGGQASARNLGLDYVKTEWVTFIDPDDFVNSIYFENIDTILTNDKNNDIGLVQCRWRIYQEDQNKYHFNHPLDFRFKNGNKVIEYSKDKKFLPSSVATSLYNFGIIKEFNIRFNEDIKPNFEDGYFSAKYFLYMPQKRIAYASDSHYIYRKRAEGGSTLDSSWENVNRFTVVPKIGYLALLEDNINKKDEIPYAIQRLIMYDLVWYFKKIINTPQSIAFLAPSEKDEFKNLVFKIFQYIDSDVIMSFELAGFWFYHKVGFLGMLKGDKPPFNIVYIDDYDKDKNLVKLRYFYYGNPPLEEFKVDGDYIIPAYSKIRTHYFLDEIFVHEKIIWLNLSNATSSLLINFFGEDTRVSFNKKTYRDSIPITDIVNYAKKEIVLDTSKIPLFDKTIRKISKSNMMQDKYRDAYVIMDRDTQADDNAEHFYRYLKENKKELNIFFVLSKSSHDYERLEKEGFNLLPFDSLSHKCALLNAKYLISSHADKYVVDYMKPKFYGDILNYKFIFLQHGVIRDDISTWLNNKNIDTFITSMPSEYESIAGDSKYKFTPKEVVLTGLARHDRLVERNEPTENVILIMPTWRNSLVGDLKNMSAQREVTDAFYESDYAKHWKSFLHSSKLKELADKHNYKVVFFPHVNMSIYIDWFDAPSWIEVRTHKTDPILHKLFRRAKIMITDYSSVFFEMAILKKAILYYQFDFEYMYGGNHSSQLGYFDFEKDGFGPVSYREEELFSNLEFILKNSGLPSDEYVERMVTSLPFRDGKNRERTLLAIENLEKPLEEKEPNVELYRSYLNEARKSNHRELIQFYLTLLLKEDKNNKLLAIEYIDNVIKLGNLEEAKELLNFYDIDESQYSTFIIDIEKQEKNIALLSKETHKILKSKSLFELTMYSNLEKIYNEKKWLLFVELCSFVDIETIPKNKKSYFYYMYGRALRLVDRKKKALKLLAKSLSYNDIPANSAIWEYASTLYELYDERKITKELIKKPFVENSYKVENIELEMITSWFNKKHYKQVTVALELLDIDSVEEEELSRLYYMWGRTLFSIGQYARSVDKFSYLNNKNHIYEKEVLIFNAKSMTELENWKESYFLWHSIYEEYPSYNTTEVLKNIILALKNLNKSEDLESYKNKLLKYLFLNSSDNDIKILNSILG